MHQDEIIHARWIIDPVQPCIENGIVVVRDGRIAEVGRRRHQRPTRDLGDTILCPAAINPHTHLEFSNLAKPLGQPSGEFAEWIGQVIARRRIQSSDSDRSAATQQGIKEMAQAGTAAAGEIATAPMDLSAYASADFCGTVFLERLGLAVENIDHSLVELRNALVQFQQLQQQSTTAATKFRFGVSPHAPYSVHSVLFAQLVDFAVANQLPVAMHLAESRAELELLKSGSGPFRELLEALGLWRTESVQVGVRPLDYLRTLARAAQVLVIHGNYLSADELDLVASHRNKITMVYCPRTHSYFEHDSYPVTEILRRRIRLAVATDSRASNPDLNVWNELACVRTSFPELSAEQLLRMATLNGAEALGLEADWGSIQPGKCAKFTQLPVDSSVVVNDPLEYLRDRWHELVPVV